MGLSDIPTTWRPTWQFPDKYLRGKTMQRKSLGLGNSSKRNKNTDLCQGRQWFFSTARLAMSLIRAVWKNETGDLKGGQRHNYSFPSKWPRNDGLWFPGLFKATENFPVWLALLHYPNPRGLRESFHLREKLQKVSRMRQAHHNLRFDPFFFFFLPQEFVWLNEAYDFTIYTTCSTCQKTAECSGCKRQKQQEENQALDEGKSVTEFCG